ncbi:MAG: hypothetical protein E4G97_06310 [Deltaproteobacteria bacterium]|nr:MAG: hypothetical protein E4G97_06310 [Deltaproteobacteria bacterium]
MMRENGRQGISLQGFCRWGKGTTVADESKGMLDRLEWDLVALKHEYDLFLNGKRRAEPMKERKELETKLLVGSRRAIIGNADQLRFNNLSGRYWTFANLWTRTVRDLEEGRMHRDIGGSVRRTLVERTEPVEREQIARAADALLEARRSCGLGGEPSDIPSLRDTLYARALEISASGGGKKVEFVVSVEGGKPKVKAVLR